jgi:hypothetical protein
MNVQVKYGLAAVGVRIYHDPVPVFRKAVFTRDVGG